MAKRQSRRRFLQAATIVTAGLWVGRASAVAQVAGGRRPLKIGIIGAGRQGGALGLRWAAAGHEILFSSRHPETLKDLVARAGAKARAGLPEEAATFGDVILVAVPYAALGQVGRDYAAPLKGKIVIECGNPVERRDGPMAKEALAMGTGVASAESLPGVRLVRAFNALSYLQVDKEANRPGERLAIPIAGDDHEAVAVTARLTEDAGFDPVIVGPLARAKDFDAGTPVYVKGLTARQLREALGLPPQP